MFPLASAQRRTACAGDTDELPWSCCFSPRLPLLAAGGRPLTPAEKGQADFERSRWPPRRRWASAAACAQTQAALLAVAAPEDAPVLEFRKGYCELAAAAVTGEAARLSRRGRRLRQGRGKMGGARGTGWPGGSSRPEPAPSHPARAGADGAPRSGQWRREPGSGGQGDGLGAGRGGLPRQPDAGEPLPGAEPGWAASGRAGWR